MGTAAVRREPYVAGISPSLIPQTRKEDIVLASALKERMRQKQLTIGPLMTFDFWAGHLEIFKAEGMHYAILDLEHGSPSLPMVEELCRVARLIDFPLIIRPESSIYHLVRKYIDMGAAGLMIPWTERQEQIDALRDAVFTPPRGKRGPGGASIFHNRTLDRAGWDEIEANLFLIAQIETPAGIAKLPELVNHDWIDATMLGPYDLSLNMNLCYQPDHPELVAAIKRVHSESAKVGKPSGMVVGSREHAKFWMEQGFHFFIYGEPSVMVRTESRRIAREMQELEAEMRQKA
jgi:2-keto-3-deoxy-L-rhamnonate aldolase RhmA